MKVKVKSDSNIRLSPLLLSSWQMGSSLGSPRFTVPGSSRLSLMLKTNNPHGLLILLIGDHQSYSVALI